MKPYYIRVHFAGPYVDGFVIPQANDEKHAMYLLKKHLAASIAQCKRQGKRLEHGLGSLNVPRMQEYMRSLRRPWRQAGDRRAHGEKKMVGNSRGPVVIVEELVKVVQCGYWLQNVLTDQHLCNERN